MNQNIIRALTLTIPFILFSCNAKDAEKDQAPPEYTQPAYTMRETVSTDTLLTFTDITKSSGIDFVHENGAFGKKWMPETIGSGGGFLDYNKDGLPDLFLVNATWWPGHEKSKRAPTQKLYRNEGNGKFRDVTREVGLDVPVYGMGCTFADYDSDGDVDIYVTAVGNNILWRNDGNQFTNVTTALGISGNSNVSGDPPAWSTSAVWLDADGDGWLDLFVCNYVKWTPETDLFTTLDGVAKSYATPQQYQGETCRLYRNMQGRAFVDMTKNAGVFNPEGKSLGVVVADFNRDGWPDIVVANDTQPNFLYQNDGNGKFTDVALQAGVAYDEFGRARAGMGIDVADIANTGKLSIAIGNFAREPISLFTQTHPGLFQDFSGNARLARASLLSLSFAVLFTDFNLDGYPDLLVANGHIEPEINRVQQDITFAQAPLLFMNDRNGKFIEAKNTGEAFQERVVARGLATADIDNDGDLDALITVNGGPPKLLRNDLSPGQTNWIKFKLKGSSPNVQAIGAVVTIWAEDLKQSKTVRTGSSYLSQSYAGEIIFGLGQKTAVDSLEIRWPASESVLKRTSFDAGKTHLLGR